MTLQTHVQERGVVTATEEGSCRQGSAIKGTGPAPPSPVAVLRGLGPGSLLVVLQGGSVLQEAVVKAVCCRHKSLHALDSRWGRSRWSWVCARGAGTHAGVT